MHKQQRRDRKSVLKNQNRIVDASVSQLAYSLVEHVTGSDFKSQYFRDTYLSKYADPDPATALLRKTSAIEKWLSTETHNAITNERLRNVDEGFNILPRLTYWRFVKHCRRTISAILGPLHDSIVIGGFSGGASTSRRRTEAHPGFKYSDKADVTEHVGPILDTLFREAPLLRKHGIFSTLTEIEGAVLFTVPKKSDIDRCACKEPDVNMYLQRGVGKHIRSRLRKIGINLNDQSINRSLAREGSITGALATLDLSSASDTISIELVRTLLPDDWFHYLNDIRSRKVRVLEDTITTEMFSSMGNGFTFELESLLFYSICKSVLYFEGIKGRLSVYGDDIICPTLGYDMITWVLSFFGFVPNLEKSFASGPFRESCGGHYYNGADVTPFYLRRPAKRLTDVVRLANQLRKWFLTPSLGLSVGEPNPEIYDLWRKLRNAVPRKFWGGSDLDVDTQLVTPDVPNMRLARVSRSKEVPSQGLYVFWQNSNWGRSQDPEDPRHSVEDNTQYCRSRRAPKWGDLTKRQLFYEELFLSPLLGE